MNIHLNSNINIMKRSNCVTYLLGCALAWLTLTTSCEQTELEQFQQEQPTASTRCPMTIIGGLSGYADAPQTKAHAWKEGDKIYLKLKTETADVPGVATYTAGSGWKVEFYGTLQEVTDASCEARFFDGEVTATTQSVSLNAQVGIYETTEGTYTYNGTSLQLKAKLTPKMGRIRFKGQEGNTVRVYGMDSYRSYIVTSSDFNSDPRLEKLVVQADGYTPYLYVMFHEAVTNLGIVTDKGAYTRTCTPDLLGAGKSTFVTIPTPESRNNWSDGLLLTVQNTPFRMLWVPANTAKKQPAFLLAETETTVALYQNVVNKSTAYTDQTPKVSLSYTNADAFMTHLYSLMKLQFELPTLEEWQFAAAGGQSTPPYDYAGSSEIEDVAWYSQNSSGIHAVKQKAPNELGLYDMSGNAEEFTCTLSNENYTGSYYRAGGYWNSSAEDVKVTSKVSMNTSSVTQSYIHGTIRLKLPLD